MIDNKEVLVDGDLLLGESPSMQEVYNLIDKCASSDIKVLIQGETGTGKELVAKAIHKQSNRINQPFIPIDCSMLPETLVESELFGYEKGAFTGATERKLGRFELAHEGTLFLDEIANLPPNVQMKLLRFLEDKNISRLGSKVNIEVDVRVISASNVNLENTVKEGKFREDLYYRLNVFPIILPPLRERGDDIILLADYFVKKFANEQHKNNIEISKEAISALKNYHWSGNVRELKNVIERAVLLADDIIRLEHLPESIQKLTSISNYINNNDGLIKTTTNDLIVKTLIKFKWNITKAAKELGYSREWLSKRIKKEGICLQS